MVELHIGVIGILLNQRNVYMTEFESSKYKICPKCNFKSLSPNFHGGDTCVNPDCDYHILYYGLKEYSYDRK